jgi:hypothetical protein
MLRATWRGLETWRSGCLGRLARQSSTLPGKPFFIPSPAIRFAERAYIVCVRVSFANKVHAAALSASRHREPKSLSFDPATRAATGSELQLRAQANLARISLSLVAGAELPNPSATGS